MIHEKLKELLETIEEGTKDAPSKGQMTKLQMREELQLLRSQRFSYAPGTFIRRNKFGDARYKFPNETQIMIVDELFDLPVKGERDDIAHARVIVMGAEDPLATHTFSVDLRYYEEDKDEANT